MCVHSYIFCYVCWLILFTEIYKKSLLMLLLEVISQSLNASSVDVASLGKDLAKWGSAIWIWGSSISFLQ